MHYPAAIRRLAWVPDRAALRDGGKREFRTAGRCALDIQLAACAGCRKILIFNTFPGECRRATPPFRTNGGFRAWSQQEFDTP